VFCVLHTHASTCTTRRVCACSAFWVLVQAGASCNDMHVCLWVCVAVQVSGLQRERTKLAILQEAVIVASTLSFAGATRSAKVMCLVGAALGGRQDGAAQAACLRL
jgi:hypothetical protein